MKTLEEYLNESLLRHICIELKDNDIVYEKYGEYDGCSELSNYIYEKLKNNHFNNIEIKYNEVKNIDNIVFDTLYIVFEESSNEFFLNYVIPQNDDNTIKFLQDNRINDNPMTYSSINEKTTRFENCLICITYSKTRNKSLITSLCHELNHMFVDYKIQLKGFHSFLELFDNDTYKRTKEYNQHKHPIRANQLENALYLLNEYEKNAFMSQLCSEIREIKNLYSQNANKTINANKMYDIVKQLDIYKAYMNIANFINDYDNNVLTNKEKTIIVDEWEKIYNEKLNLDQIFKKIKYKFIKIKQKIESIVTKKISEEFKNITFKIDNDINLKNLEIYI